MKKTLKMLLSVIICFLMVLGSVAVGGAGASEWLASVFSVMSADAYSTEETRSIEEIPKVEETEADDLPEVGSYDEKTVLVKCEDFDEKMLGTLEYDSCERLYPNSKWYKITLANGEAVSAVEYLKGTGLFENVEYDYIMKSDATVSSVDVSSNPDSATQTYLETHGIKDLWNYQSEHGSTAGGNSDVIVAVIDSGVDYNHPDLKNNIWVNSSEIPDNRIDDDNNGYVDDYYGWDFVGNDNNPMDDNGHGTHVAGIVAAENNNIGSVGVAYNCKVMCLKAAQSSGYLNNSDIAEAVQYAYMNGASVINMSFGGSSVSLVVEETLESAYNQCVLVASAGNDSLCNNLEHNKEHDVGILYPAALTYVIGVMSCDASGNSVSSFSNYDHTAHDTVEYEVYACGEDISSTWPNGKYSVLNGTSMAAPVVSGMAALLRSTWTDRNVYSNKYIQSQIVNTGVAHPYNAILKEADLAHTVVNGYNAISTIPKPDIYALDFYTFDGTDISPANNNDGVVEAGETVHLAVELLNYGGVASNVTVTVDTHSHGDASLSDPYITFVNDTINFSNVGTYSRQTGKKIYTDGKLTDIENSFTLNIADNCPDNYYVKINVVIEYSNGLNSGDTTRYISEGSIMLVCFNGVELPEIVNEDTVFEANRHYLLPHDMTIPSGVTVTFEEGCEIEYYGYKTGYDSGFYNSPEIIVYGTLNFNGTKDSLIKIYPSEMYSEYVCFLRAEESTSEISFKYVDANNLSFISNIYENNILIENCIIINTTTTTLRSINQGRPYLYGCCIAACSIKNSYIHCGGCYVENAECSYFGGAGLNCYGSFRNNIVNRSIKHQQGSATDSFSCPTSDNIFVSIDEGDYYSYLNNIYYNTEYEHKDMFVGGYKKQAASVILGYIDSSGNPIVDIDYQITDYSNILPFVKDVIITDKNGNSVNTIGSEEVKVKIVFSRPMDTSKNPTLCFGSREPYTDYEIKGNYVSSTIWEGTYTLKAQIENGVQKFRIFNAYSSEGYELVDTIYLFGFNIDTTSAQSMNISATEVNNGIKLEWAQDDYDTLMGYNIYRSEEKNGNYSKINSTVIPENENTFIDKTIEQQKLYWYTFTVVLSDMTESGPAGKTSCIASDTIAPVITHTPVKQGSLNSNLSISCTVTDNVSVGSVTLYYRITGSDNWKYLSMLKQGDKYRATVFGSEVTLAGLQYYIVASDGVNSANSGTAVNPYSVIIIDPTNPDNPTKPDNPTIPDNPTNQDNPTANARLYIRSSATVEYRANVTITATATGVPEGYYLDIIDNYGLGDYGNNTRVSYEAGPMTSNRKYTVYVVDENGVVQEDANGNILAADCEVKVKSGFFDKLIAFFKGLFGTLPNVEIKP